jgi:pimeloyl-ACP methyl ester carboxylesterase
VVALWFAVDFGSRLDSLVLEAPAAFRSEEQLSQRTPEELQRAMFVHPERLPKDTALRDPATRERWWPLVTRLIGPAHDEALAEAMRSVTVPTLVLYGTRDGIFPPEQGRTYKRLLPNCFLEYVYDAAHAIQHDRPEAFAGIVAEFIARKGAFLATNRSTLVYP